MRLRTLNEIIKNVIDDIHDVLPDVDTKEGTFIRDVFIGPTSTQLFQLYQDAKMIEYSQSILTATGTDLDKLAQNFFVTRKGASTSTGRVRFYFGSSVPSEPITIPRGAVVSTQPSDNKPELFFITSTSADVLPGDITSYLYDGIRKEYYVELDAVSVNPGEVNNIGSAEISVLGEGLSDKITSVTNPYAFSGATEAEDDTSLILRVSLAVSGSNIGTRDGYTSFILKQDGVIDAKVVAAGDPLMTRDNGEGGMVDIYVKSELIAEGVYTFNVDYNYITNTAQKPAYSDIVIPKQPVTKIISLIGTRTGVQTPIVYLNGSDYLQEQGSDRYYFADVEWTFTEPDGETAQDYAVRYLNERLSVVNYLTDLRYNLDWLTIKDSLENDTTSLPLDPYFSRGFYNDGLIYMIRSKNDDSNPYIGGRYFIKKNGAIHERVYVNPDFVLVKDLSDYGNSIKATDAIHWLDTGYGAKRPIENETLTIKYGWNEKIEDLQNKVEEKRVLTADVLLKQARKVPIEIKMDIVPYAEYDVEDVRVSVINKISTFINNIKQLGASIDRAGMVSVVRITPGVKSVDVEKVFLSRSGGVPEKELKVEGFEYFELETVYITMLPSDSIV